MDDLGTGQHTFITHSGSGAMKGKASRQAACWSWPWGNLPVRKSKNAILAMPSPGAVPLSFCSVAARADAMPVHVQYHLRSG